MLALHVAPLLLFFCGGGLFAAYYVRWVYYTAHFRKSNWFDAVHIHLRGISMCRLEPNELHIPVVLSLIVNNLQNHQAT